MTPFSVLMERRFPLLALLSLMVLVAAGLGAALASDRNVRHQQESEAEAQASLLASAVSGALAFGDRAAAQDYVDAVQVNPDVLVAAVYGPDDRLFASYARDGQAARPVARRRAAGAYREDGYLRIVRPVEESGQRLGTVGLRLRAESPSQRFNRYSIVLLTLGLSILVVATLLIAQAALRRANRELKTRAEALVSANARLEAEMAERERVEAELRQSQKMEAIGRLTGGVAHDFNNLLMVASSGIELLERTEDPARRKMLSDGVRQAVDKGSALTRQLLAFSRRAPLKSQVIDLKLKLAELRFMLERSLRENIELVLDLAPDTWPVEADPGELELALLNLAVNARDAMPGSGRLTVTIRNESDQNGAPDRVTIEVSDTGSGMSAELIGRVFEPFFTTKEVGRGTGLGLSQVYGFARSSGGEAAIRSVEGAGTTIVLSLPRSLREPAGADGLVVSDESAPSAPSGSRVLLVEDDDAVAASVGHMLRDLGYAYVRAPTAEQALAELARGQRFDLVFSDMIMPGVLNGLELAKAIRVRHPDLPVVLTTGFSEAASEASTAGFMLLSKPYGIRDLALGLRKAADTN